MKPALFGLVRAESVEHALATLAEHGDEAKVLAGGQSLGPLLNLRLATQRVLVDVNGLSELDELVETPAGGLVIGAMTRHRTLERAADRGPWLLVADAMPLVGHVAIRNRGTVGGSLAHADPAAELPAIAVAVAATVTARSQRGSRQVAAAELFETYYTTTLAADELLTAAELPPPPPRTGSSWLEFARRHGDYGYVGVAAVLTLDELGRCADVRLVCSGVADTPHRVAACAELVGRRPDAAALAEVAAIATAELEPVGDADAPVHYKRRLVRALAERTLGVASDRAQARCRDR